MPESDASERGNVNHSASNSQLSANERVMATRRAFLELEGSGISDFEIFNALADLYYQRGPPFDRLAGVRGVEHLLDHDRNLRELAEPLEVVERQRRITEDIDERPDGRQFGLLGGASSRSRNASSAK